MTFDFEEVSRILTSSIHIGLQLQAFESLANEIETQWRHREPSIESRSQQKQKQSTSSPLLQLVWSSTRTSGLLGQKSISFIPNLVQWGYISWWDGINGILDVISESKAQVHHDPIIHSKSDFNGNDLHNVVNTIVRLIQLRIISVIQSKKYEEDPSQQLKFASHGLHRHPFISLMVTQPECIPYLIEEFKTLLNANSTFDECSLIIHQILKPVYKFILLSNETNSEYFKIHATKPLFQSFWFTYLPILFHHVHPHDKQEQSRSQQLFDLIFDVTLELLTLLPTSSPNIINDVTFWSYISEMNILINSFSNNHQIFWNHLQRWIMTLLFLAFESHQHQVSIEPFFKICNTLISHPQHSKIILNRQNDDLFDILFAAIAVLLLNTSSIHISPILNFIKIGLEEVLQNDDEIAITPGMTLLIFPLLQISIEMREMEQQTALEILSLIKSKFLKSKNKVDFFSLFCLLSSLFFSFFCFHFYQIENCTLKSKFTFLCLFTLSLDHDEISYSKP